MESETHPARRLTKSQFTRNEIIRLGHLVEKYRHIIENRKPNAETWKEKHNCWGQITVEFNNGATSYWIRNEDQLRNKYKNLKRLAKKKLENKRKAQSALKNGTDITEPEVKVEVVDESDDGIAGVLDICYDDEGSACYEEDYSTYANEENPSTLDNDENLSSSFMSIAPEGLPKEEKKTEDVTTRELESRIEYMRAKTLNLLSKIEYRKVKSRFLAQKIQLREMAMKQSQTPQ